MTNNTSNNMHQPDPAPSTQRPTPKTNSERTIKSMATLKAKGGRRIPSGYLQPSEAQALEELLSNGYAASPLAVVKAALLDAHKKVKRSKNIC